MHFFRKVDIAPVAGKLFLHHLPGMAGEPLADDLDHLKQFGVSQVVCLLPGEEIRSLAPDYHRALQAGKVPATVHRLNIPDGSAPTDEEGYADVVAEVVRALRRGRAILVHCRGGIGRTGTFATAVLLALGYQLDDALDRVEDAGSWPESGEQMAWLERKPRGEL